MPPERDWTILIYMAGDNGRTFETKYGNYSLMAEMTTAGYEDIGELQVAGGTTDQVAVLIQFDTDGREATQGKALVETSLDKGSYRLEIGAGATKWTDHIVESIPESNTGDPAELAKFIVWGMNRCPAKHTMLVLWNHGLGWSDEDIYKEVRSVSRSVRSGRSQRKRNAAAFRTVAPKVRELVDQEPNRNKRGILADDSSLDFLTNVEMSQALRVAQVAADEADVTAIFADKRGRLKEAMADVGNSGRRKLSVIGMDACLMAMVEVNYQARHFAQVMVASQEVEPINGWPYTPIVEKLNASPGMSPQALGTLIVDEYMASYTGTRSESEATQAAIDLTAMEDTRQRIGAFAKALAGSYDTDIFLKGAFADTGKALRRVFEDPEYVDLANLVDGFLKRYQDNAVSYNATPNSSVVTAGEQLLNWLQLTDGGPIIAHAAGGELRRKALGMSIYLPQDMPADTYKTLDFADSGWMAFLEAIS